MKQKKFYLSLAASMMLAVTGFTSCTVEDNPGSNVPETPLADVVDDFDEGSVIENGSCQGASVANYWVHEWRTMDERFEGPANIVQEPTNRENRCVAVVVRSQAEAEAAGNPTLDNGNYAAWDSQFFITFGAEKALKMKDKYRVTLKVKADVAQTVGTQFQKAPGEYLYWMGIGDVNFTEDWTIVDTGWKEVADFYGSADGGYTIAFNLATGIHNTYYFDDIRVEIDPYDTFDDDNLVQNGTANKDNVANFVANDFPDPDGAQQFGPARIVTDPADATNRCFVVGTNNNVANPWDAQLFITFPEEQALKVGDKFQLTMKIKADKAQSGCDSQCHANPTQYIIWHSVGQLNFTEEWAEFDSGVITVAADMVKNNDSGAAPFHTIAFNLSNANLGANQMYFDDIKLTVVERAPDKEYEWVEVQINGDLEGEDVSGIACREKGMPDQYVIQEGIGKDGTRGTYVTSSDAAAEVWDSQFFVVLPEEYPEGTMFKFQMDVKADAAATVSVQTHNNPGTYIGGAFSNFGVTTDWTTVKGEGTFGSNNGELVKSFAFNLNEDKTLKTTFYFDNIKVWIAKEKK